MVSLSMSQDEIIELKVQEPEEKREAHMEGRPKKEPPIKKIPRSEKPVVIGHATAENPDCVYTRPKGYGA